MAEIVRWSSRKTTQLFSQQIPSAEQVEVREKVVVRSIFSPHVDVSVLRDMVAALDEARVPSRAVVQVKVDEGRVTQLVVEADLDPPEREQQGAEAPAAGGQ